MSKGTAKAPSKRQHYYMITGEIVFRPKDAETSGMVRMNALVLSDDKRFAVAQIAKAQQALQFQFHSRMQDANLQVLDVVILALMDLGEFTDAEFNATPAGMAMKEVSMSEIDEVLAST